MKKTFAGFLGMVVIFSMCAATAFAAGPKGGRNFVDADGDGICDNINSRCIYTDADGDGICDVCGRIYLNCPAGDGTAFVDADGDGICDNCDAYHWCGMTGTGGGNFVDADGDGVCDNYASGQGRGNGQGNGTQGRHGRNFVDANGDGVCDNYASGRGSQGCGNGFRGGCGR